VLEEERSVDQSNKDAHEEEEAKELEVALY
jgi:hypothetical protein